MKRYFMFFLLLSLLCLITDSLFAIEFSIEKINTFAFSQLISMMEIDPPYLYALTQCALEIYEIQADAQLQKLSELPIMLPGGFVRKDNYIYIGSSLVSSYDPGSLFLYQIDISDKENPYINNTVEFDNSYGSIHPALVGDYLIAENIFQPEVYTLPDLELYGTIQEDISCLIPIKENICISPLGSSVFDMYETSDILNIQYLVTIDMSPYHQGYSPGTFKVINDTILIAGGHSAVSFWDISDSADWEHISHYEPNGYLAYNPNFVVYENSLILLKFDGLELVDISDLSNPQLIDYLENHFNSFSIVNDNENIYVNTYHDGIRMYYIENDELHYSGNYFEYPGFMYGYLYSTYLFLDTMNYGLYLFDVSNPYEPVEIPTILLNAPCVRIHGNGELIALHYYNDFTIKIYDITDPPNPILRNTIVDLTYPEWEMSIPFFDDSEPQSMYLFNIENGNLKKYDISEPGTPPLLLTYNEIFQECSFFVRNGYGYALSTETYPQHLYIIGGLNDNNPTIVNTIENFSQYTYPAVNLCGNYLCLRGYYDEPKLYSLDDPENPQLACILEIPTINPVSIYDNLLFTKIWNLSYVYDLNECDGDTLQPIDYFYGLCNMSYADFIDIDDAHYLFVTEQACVGVYEFSYTSSIDEIPEAIASPKIINFPNPFSTSTTISFNLHHRDTENAEIKIYNIKGQLVRELGFSISDLGFGEAIWDGKDSSGKTVPSGVYLYRITTDSFTSDTKKMILIR